MRFLLYVVLVIACGLTAQLVIASQSPTATAPKAPVSVAISPLIIGTYLVAAPGKVEPASEEITVGASIIGLIKEVLVKEGDHLARGQIVATIESDEYKAALTKAEAQLRLREAELLRLNNGARVQERRQAQAAVQEAEAVLKNSAIELERRRVLVAQGFTSQEIFDRAQRENSVARQRLEGAKQKFALIDDRARDEDIAIAEAQVDVARAARDEAQAQMDKTAIRSPIDGTVLRVTRHAGELISTFMDTPIVTMGDVSQLFVRADVDEADVGKISAGMAAYVTADAFGDQRFTGRVTRIGRSVGKKNIRTDEAREHMDSKILEVMIELDDSQTLPPGLRVNAFMMSPETVERTGALSGEVAARN
jgi:HlyD family secretion protein